MNSGNKGSFIVASLVIAGVAFAAYLIAGQYFDNGPSIKAAEADDLIVGAPTEIKSSPTKVDTSVLFMQECSGMDLNHPAPGVQIAAASECVGRVRGFVDAHNLMVAMVAYSAGKRSGDSIQLFCVASDIEADKLVATIMDWADAHKEDYTKIVDADPTNAANIVILKALHEAYPCINS